MSLPVPAPDRMPLSLSRIQFEPGVQALRHCFRIPWQLSEPRSLGPSSRPPHWAGNEPAPQRTRMPRSGAGQRGCGSTEFLVRLDKLESPSQKKLLSRHVRRCQLDESIDQAIPVDQAVISKSGYNYLIIICNYIHCLKSVNLFNTYL
jgi:hypothetical protein